MAQSVRAYAVQGHQPSGNLMDQLSKRGMQFNGTTFYDRTNYYETFPCK